MAVEYGWTGFEGGETDAVITASLRGGVAGVRDVAPRSGQYCLTINPDTVLTNSWVGYVRKDLTIGTGLAVGASATTKARVFMRMSTFPDRNDASVFAVGVHGVPGWGGLILLDTTGHFCTYSLNHQGTYSMTALALGNWYRLDLTHVVTRDSATTGSTVTSADVYTEGGLLIESVTVASTGSPIGTPALPDTIEIGVVNFVGIYRMDFDDFWWGSADGGDQATLAFPATAWRITRVPPLAQGSSAAWTGDFRTVIDCPFEPTTDEQVNAVVGADTTFTKATAASMGIGNIDGVLMRGKMRSAGSAGNDAFLVGGTAYTVAVPTAFPAVGLTTVLYGAVATATYDGWEFGARNVRGTSLRLGNCYLEVLHDGASLPAPYTNVSGTFQLNLIAYTGAGGYQTITGMGFASQVLLIKGVSNTADRGGFKVVRGGGTRNHVYPTSGGFDANAVLAITDDGFLLGPNVDVNRAGSTYLAIGMQDGGAGIGGFHLSTLSRMGTALDNFAVDFMEAFTPDIAINQTTTASTIVRTSAMAGDLSIGWSGLAAVTNLIQALTASGYQVGSGAEANVTSRVHLSFILRIGTELTSMVHVGTLTPSGSSATITGIPFTPVFVMCQRQGNTASGHWRSTLIHTGANSSLWTNGGTFATTGITSMTADGFTIGALLATAGTPVFWIALAPGSIPLPPTGSCVVTLDVGTAAGAGLPCRTDLAVGSAIGAGAPCRLDLAV